MLTSICQVTTTANATVSAAHRYLVAPGGFADLEEAQFNKFKNPDDPNQFAFDSQGGVITAFAPNVPFGGFRYGIDFQASATIAPSAFATGSYWWQEKEDLLQSNPTWVQDGQKPSKTSGTSNGTTTMTDSPGAILGAVAPTTATSNGTNYLIYTFPPAVPAAPNGTPKKSMRYRCHLVIILNGVEVAIGYYEYGYDFDPSATPQITVIQPVWHKQ
jgi:hypothetical protein